MDQLDALGDLHLEELVLEGNPLCAKYLDRDLYVR
jgi:hypothetical protein